MINSSALIGELTIEEFIPVISAGIGIFILSVLLVVGIVMLVAWGVDKLRLIEERAHQRDINKIKRECFEDITRYYDDVYKRLVGDDNAENE